MGSGTRPVFRIDHVEVDDPPFNVAFPHAFQGFSHGLAREKADQVPVVVFRHGLVQDMLWTIFASWMLPKSYTSVSGRPRITPLSPTGRGTGGEGLSRINSKVIIGRPLLYSHLYREKEPVIPAIDMITVIS